MALSSVRPESVERLATRLAAGDEALLQRFRAVRSFSRNVRASEYHITNACNLRCRGCWFFTFGFDRQTKDQTDLGALKAFIQRERARHVNAVLLIGGGAPRFPGPTMGFRQGRSYLTGPPSRASPFAPAG